MMVQVGHDVEPHDKQPVRDPVQVDDGRQAQHEGGGGEDSQHANEEAVGGQHLHGMRGGAGVSGGQHLHEMRR